MSVESAAAWYEYGNVLLLKEEENPSNGLLGNVSSDPDQPPPEDEDVGDEEEEENGDAGGDQEEGEGEEEADEVEGDLQIAWEALDVSPLLPLLCQAELNLTDDVWLLLGCKSYVVEAGGRRYQYSSFRCKPVAALAFNFVQN
jgi:hypothetical protein